MLCQRAHVALDAVAHDADVVIAIGTRLSDFPTASWTAWQHPGVRFIAINVAELDAAKARALPLVGDARATLEELSAALAARGWDGVSAERRSTQESLRHAWNVEAGRVLHLQTPQHVSQPEAIRLTMEPAAHTRIPSRPADAGSASCRGSRTGPSCRRRGC